MKSEIFSLRLLQINLRRICIKYKSLVSDQADEIILERDGDHFSTLAAGFDRSGTTKFFNVGYATGNLIQNTR